jgi:hypothetical protein
MATIDGTYLKQNFHYPRFQEASFKSPSILNSLEAKVASIALLIILIAACFLYLFSNCRDDDNPDRLLQRNRQGHGDNNQAPPPLSGSHFVQQQRLQSRPALHSAYHSQALRNNTVELASHPFNGQHLALNSPFRAPIQQPQMVNQPLTYACPQPAQAVAAPSSGIGAPPTLQMPRTVSHMASHVDPLRIPVRPILVSAREPQAFAAPSSGIGAPPTLQMPTTASHMASHVNQPKVPFRPILVSAREPQAVAALSSMPIAPPSPLMFFPSQSAPEGMNF